MQVLCLNVKHCVFLGIVEPVSIEIPMLSSLQTPGERAACPATPPSIPTPHIKTLAYRL